MKHLPNVLLSLVLIALLPTAAFAQEGHDHSRMKADSEATDTSDTAEGHACCQNMMQMHQKMQKHVKAKDAELARLVEEMKSATGEAKVDAVAAALEELIDQHRSMHSMMMGQGSMNSMMMKMHQHMQSMGGEMDMSKCPMMQEMKMKSDDEAGDDHSDGEVDGEEHEDHHSR